MSAVATNPYWMPFTANRDFNKNPRVITGAEGHWYTRADGTRMYDTFSGLWTTGVGHCHPKIVAAVQEQVATLDYCITFQITNDKALALAERVALFLHQFRFGIRGYRAQNRARLSPCPR